MSTDAEARADADPRASAPPRDDAGVQTVCALGGVATLVVAMAGWLLAGVLPLPLGPSDSASEVVSFYADGQGRVLAGLIVATLGLGLVFPLIAVISTQMLRMEGRAPVLTVLQTVTGAATGVLLTVPMLLMTAIAFRPERDPGLTVMLNDLAWLLFLTPIAPFMIQNVAIGVAVLRDRGHVFPRWVGYANFWIAFAFVPDVLAFVFHSGAFAWNGVLVFWLALAAYAVWLLVMSYAVVGAVRRQRVGADAVRGA